MIPTSTGGQPTFTMPVSTGTDYPLITFNSDCLLFNNLTQAVYPNELITYSAIIPKNIKKKDFISSIIKMFNLYVEPDKDFPNSLRLNREMIIMQVEPLRIGLKN